MNRIFTFLLLQSVCLGALLAQPNRRTQDESTLPGKRSELNVRNATYPRLLPGNRIEFKIKAPDAQKVQIDLAYIIHSGFISGYQNRYGDNLKPPTNVYHRMTA